MSLPKTVMSDTLNRATVDTHRLGSSSNYLHVSDLIGYGDRKFCGREHLIKSRGLVNTLPQAILPSLRFLFAMGNFYHDYIRYDFANNSQYGRYLWGFWRCNCGAIKKLGCYGDCKDHYCDNCKSKTTVYDEYYIFSEEFGLVGHPDALIFLDGIMYVYEIKTINRKSVDFERLDTPLAEHTIQASVYHYLMKHEEGFNMADDIRYIYADRGASHVFDSKAFKELSRDHDEDERVLEYLNKAKEFWKNKVDGKLGNRICKNIGCSRAKGCPVASMCFNMKG